MTLEEQVQRIKLLSETLTALRPHLGDWSIHGPIRAAYNKLMKECDAACRDFSGWTEGGGDET